jgi:hypothetical protein
VQQERFVVSPSAMLRWRTSRAREREGVRGASVTAHRSACPGDDDVGRP